jgi:hypothetical protein
MDTPILRAMCPLTVKLQVLISPVLVSKAYCWNMANVDASCSRTRLNSFSPTLVAAGIMDQHARERIIRKDLGMTIRI